MPSPRQSRRDAAAARRSRRRRTVAVIGGILVVVAAAVAGSLATGGSRSPSAAKTTPARHRAPVRLHPPGPIPGYLLIADRGNNRMLLVDSTRHIYWRYPRNSNPAMPFVFDDDTFFGPTLRTIVSNQEDQDTIQVISFPGGRVLWRYGHVNVKSGAHGYLNTPDDAYLLPNRIVSVADAYNCRVLFISPAHRIVKQYGTTGVCRHDPPRYLGAVNGATPLPDGGTLVSEIAGSWIDDIAHDGRVRWAVQAPVAYPSDPQLLSPNRILLADYSSPGSAIVMTRTGRVVWRYGPSSGPGMLNHPSLATRVGPGLIAINDDYRDRVVLVDMHTRRIVWQYGHTDRAGTAAGYLNTPDGLDLLRTDGAQRIPTLVRLLSRTAPARPRSPQGPRNRGGIRTVSSFALPAPVEREVGVADGGRIVLAGGLDAAGSSTAGVFELQPSTGKLRSLGSVPQAFHDAAGAILGHELFVFGGGSAQSSPTVQRFDLRSGTASVVGVLPRPLSDVSAATVGGTVYLVGGYDGRVPRREIYRTTDGRTFTLVARLPVGLRYPAVAAQGGKVVIAGGTSTAGPSARVFVFDPSTSALREIPRLPQPVAHAEAFALGGRVYVAGGQDASGSTLAGVAAVDPASASVGAVVGALPVHDAPSVTLGSTAYVLGGASAAGTIPTVRRIVAG